MAKSPAIVYAKKALRLGYRFKSVKIDGRSVGDRCVAFDTSLGSVQILETKDGHPVVTRVGGTEYGSIITYYGRVEVEYWDRQGRLQKIDHTTPLAQDRFPRLDEILPLDQVVKIIPVN